MRKRDNFAEINEMRKMLSEVKSLTLENFIMPEEDSFEEETPVEADNEEEVRQIQMICQVLKKN